MFCFNECNVLIVAYVTHSSWNLIKWSISLYTKGKYTHFQYADWIKTNVKIYDLIQKNKNSIANSYCTKTIFVYCL